MAELLRVEANMPREPLQDGDPDGVGREGEGIMVAVGELRGGGEGMQLSDRDDAGIVAEALGEDRSGAQDEGFVVDERKGLGLERFARRHDIVDPERETSTLPLPRRVVHGEDRYQRAARVAMVSRRA